MHDLNQESPEYKGLTNSGQMNYLDLRMFSKLDHEIIYSSGKDTTFHQILDTYHLKTTVRFAKI
ncbi:MAG: hypothetical protein BM555_05850 [Crocinitomix sp. MedPE-SWsnd]|nr:MAG: hypothetical protein BM555_05850 [Crocinitomix sp. MedPE-SWsnd]